MNQLDNSDKIARPSIRRIPGVIIHKDTENFGLDTFVKYPELDFTSLPVPDLTKGHMRIVAFLTDSVEIKCPVPLEN